MRFVKHKLKKILFSKFLGKILLRFLITLHSRIYDLIGKYAYYINDGIHPKREILKYEEWFIRNIGQNQRVVDLGCNSGYMAIKMSEKANYVIGIDISEELIEEAKKTIKKNVDFVCADINSYDFSLLGKIDILTMSNILEHIENRVDFLKRILSSSRWRKGRKILIRVPMIDRDWLSVYKKNIGLDYRLDPTHFTEYTLVDFKKELNEANIELVSYEIRFGEIYAICK